MSKLLKSYLNLPSSLMGLLAAMAIVMASCGGDGFKLDGDLAELDGTTVRIVYQSDSGMVDEAVNVDKKGHFTYKGHAAQPLLLHVLSHSGNPLAKLIAAAGDRLKIQGNAGQSLGIKIKGSTLNDEWQTFIDEHRAFYADPNPGRRDAAIEKFVKENPANLLSTVLLMADYSDLTKAGQLLGQVNSEVRPSSLTRVLKNRPSGRKNTHLPRIMSLTLVKHNGDFEEIKLTNRVTLLNLWVNPQVNRNELAREIEAATSGDKLNVIDVLVEADTLHWHRTIAGDPKSWVHYWAPGGPLEQGLQLLGISSMPWYAVTDSTGLVTYSGPDLKQALKTASR